MCAEGSTLYGISENTTEGELAKIRLSDLDIDKSRSIGKGAYGDVHLAIHLPTGKNLAVKKLLKESLMKPKMLKTLQREIKIHKQLKHINIVRFYANLEDSKHFYLVMEYI